MGSDKVDMRRCPRAVVRDCEINLLPYYSDYIAGRGWPDGTGRFYQPVKLISAFGILNQYVNTRQAK
jgi:hypothetical protein